MVRTMKPQISIGVVSKVFPNKIVIEIPDTTKINQNFLGDFYMCDGINTFISIYKSKFQKFIYQIISLYEQEKPFNDEEMSKFTEKAYFEAIPIGEIQDQKFKFGLSRFPMIGNDVFLTINQDVDTIFNHEKKDLLITLGTIASHNNFTPMFSVDSLLTHHMSILGNTGSGKSTTVRKLLHEMVYLAENEKIDIKKANFVIFDVHDEYESLPEKYVNKLKVEELSIPLETLNLEDWINLVQPSSAVQLPILMNGLRMANLIEHQKVDNDWIRAFCALELYNNVQTEAVAKRTKIIGLLNGIQIDGMDDILKEYTQFGNFNTRNNDYETQFKEKLEKFIYSRSQYKVNECRARIEELMESADCVITNLNNLLIGIDIIFLFEEMKGNSQVRSYCSTLITRIENLISTYSTTLFDKNAEKLVGFKEGIQFNSGFTIFKCSNLDDLDLLFFTSYILRFIYKQQKENRKSNNYPKLFNFVFDEAHKYIVEDNNDEKIRSLKIFEQIAKEGRKFGIFMILASQRPNELSKTVLSQCNNFILHRIRNNIDIEQMRKSIPYINDSQLLRISYLKTGSALLVGEAFSIPMEIIINGDIYGEYSKTHLPSEVWKFQ
jgi:hypothetical protein